MALPQLTVPFGTPFYMADGHGVQEASQYAHPRFQTGHSRARRVWTSSDRDVTAVLELTRAQMTAFFEWFEGPLQDNGGLFSARVANDETDAQEHLWWTAEFKQPPEHQPLAGLRWRVTSTLRLTGAGQLDAPYTGELGYAVTVSLSGSVAASVTPLLGYGVTVALLQQLLLGYSVTVALTQAEVLDQRVTTGADRRVTTAGDTRVATE